MFGTKKLTILVDLDDTMTDLLSAWVSWLNAMHGLEISCKDIKEWDMTKAFPSLTAEEIYSPFHCSSFWHTVQPKQGASEVLQQIKADGHDIFVVTATNYRTMSAKFDACLFGNFPFLHWSDVIVTNNKQMVNGDILIDDGIHNLEGGKYEKILMTAPHNVAYNAEANGMHRVKDWDDVYKIINKMAEE